MSARRVLLALAAAAAPAPAFAHAVGERYDLPLPVHLYILGGTLTVALSFAVVALVVRTHRAAPVALPAGRRQPADPALAIASRILQALGLAFFLLAIAAGLFGEQHPARNLATTLVWIVWWIGLAFVAAFVADLWPHLNPWRTIACLAERVAARFGLARPPRPYPRRWAEWPAVAWLLAFVWFEFVYPSPSHPRNIAIAALVYALATFAGMALFGRETWLRRGDAFTVFFVTLGRFAPIRWHGGAVRFRLWGAGLAHPVPLSRSMVAFILLMLAAVLFDGFLGTGLWRLIERGVRSLLPYGADRESIIAATLSLLGLWLVFLGAYDLASSAMARVGGGAMGGREIASRFALSLVPIGVGYNLAHNLSYLLVQGQAIAALLSDPFGFGWNLFGTAHWQPEIGVIDAGAVWVVTLLAIVGGHLISVYLAHLAALRLFAKRGTALRALVPMTILMVLYTGVSLTVIAEPLVRFRKPDPSYTRLAPALPALAAAVDDARRRSAAVPAMSLFIESDGPVFVVTMDRPKARNAVDPEQAERLREAFDSFERNDEAKVAVFTGANGVFCAGYDLKSFADRKNDDAKKLDYDPEGEGPMGPSRRLLSKPVIAAVEGHAVAGGLELALWCDMRVASETAVFGVFCRRWGVPLIDGGTVRLPRVVGMGRALDMILTGRPVEAREAYEWGLANRLVPAGRARDAAVKLAKEIARFPELCMRTDRMSAFRQWDMDLPSALKMEGREGLAPLLQGARDGAARFASGKGRGGDFGEI